MKFLEIKEQVRRDADKEKPKRWAWITRLEML
jgi:hypothetical protein